jgi:hypothetical protein
MRCLMWYMTPINYHLLAKKYHSITLAHYAYWQARFILNRKRWKYHKFIIKIFLNSLKVNIQIKNEMNKERKKENYILPRQHFKFFLI